jgi:hypothetical protein
VDPTHYLDEVHKIATDLDNTIISWNSSPRGRAELLAAESSIRSLNKQAESLDPPDDFRSAHEHFLNALHATLNAIFALVDNSEANLTGNESVFFREFDLAMTSINAALAERDLVCWQN